MQAHRLWIVVGIESCTSEGDHIRIAAGVHDRLRPDGGQPGLVRQDHGTHAVALGQGVSHYGMVEDADTGFAHEAVGG